MKGQSTALPPTNSPTETEAAAAAPSLKPSETAGVVIGSTTGVLLAIVAAIFVIRRYHALKHNNDGSGPYPEMAYLYDPFPDHSEGDSGRDEASTLLSGGTGVRPSASSRSITLPRAPHNSLDDEYHHTYNVNTIRYSDPGNPFTDANDPFLDWRSSRVISTPTDTASALAAAVTGYSKGPQKPLPPLPTTHCTLSDHIIPSPTLTPLPPDCSLRRSPAISARNSVNSLRSLRRLHRLNPPSPPSLAPAHPTKPQRNRTLPLTTNDLPLPVDTRSETPHSITLYANPSSYHLLPNAFSYTSSTEDEEDTAAEQEMSHTSRSEMSFSSTTTITGSAVADEGVEVPYTDFPTPPLRRLEQGVAMGDGSMEGLVGSPLVVSPRSYRFLGKG
ncbi:hypothetical protein COCHEDRAFT_1154102 [Bipolaris maydis C5]|uniref:Uncharacterized protein n=2 Tax=Cochliobolus heterostrophus TaxID=5016 RepID=M2U4L9_COCH5|nr:hypothetical protein COCHEDRAFT_1154102 [Bipolaris maydis C5]